MKKYLHVYRLENPTTGVGVYRDEDPLDFSLQQELHDAHSQGKDGHPTPYRENLGDSEFQINYNHIISGCRNIKLLKRWFGPFYRRLIKAGYIVAKYRVDNKHIRYSKLQAIFDSKKAIKIRKNGRTI